MAHAIVPLTLTDPHTSQTIQVTIEADERGLSLAFAGYGDYSSADGYGHPVLIELYEGKLFVHIWADINEENPTHSITMEMAREDHRPQ